MSHDIVVWYKKHIENINKKMSDIFEKLKKYKDSEVIFWCANQQTFDFIQYYQKTYNKEFPYLIIDNCNEKINYTKTYLKNAFLPNQKLEEIKNAKVFVINSEYFYDEILNDIKNNYNKTFDESFKL